MLKIGHTDNLARRMSEFDRETGADSGMVLEFAFSCPAGIRERVERTTHRLAAKHRRRGEWFKLDLVSACEYVMEAGRVLGVALQVAHDRQLVSAITRRNHIDRLKLAVAEAYEARDAGPKPDVRDLIQTATTKRHKATKEHLNAIYWAAHKAAVEKFNWIPKVAAGAGAFAMGAWIENIPKLSGGQGFIFIAIGGAIAYMFGTFNRDGKADKAAQTARKAHENDTPPVWEQINADLAAATQERIRLAAAELEHRVEQAEAELERYINPHGYTRIISSAGG